MKINWRPWLIAVSAGVIGAGVMATATAYAAAEPTAAATTISGCVSSKGDLRVVAAGSSCSKNETPLSWNIQGPAGPAGVAGPAGPAGPAGNGVTAIYKFAATD